MIRLPLKPPSGDAWTDWVTRARAAIAALVDKVTKEKKDPEIDEKLYKERKPDIAAISSGKCAYCETAITFSQPGDVEHYRPKGRVRNLDGEVAQDDAGRDHPGYYWLAYEPANLLLSCEKCNRQGKHDYFPVAGRRAFGPGDDLSEEEPLLLNPLEDDPADHLGFDPTGVISWRTEKGRVTVERLQLNREGLLEARGQAWRDGRNEISLWADAVRDGAEQARKDREARIRAFKEGTAPYSAFSRLAMRAYRAELEAGLDSLVGDGG